MSNSSSSKQILLSVIGIAILVVVVVGITFAFFNYTRTGQANVIRTGQINFLTTQGTTINLTDVFPVASNEVGNSNVMTLRIEGDTTYSGGEEFEITFESVNNVIGTSPNEVTIPINYIATYTPTSSGENIGSAATDYFSERGLTSTVYDLTETGEIEAGKQVLVGFIPANGEIDGTLTIRAYLDSSRIAITDTLEGTEEASAEYENGTTTTWVKERTVLTTEEWNNLRDTQTPLSFKIKAVSQEGTWVEEPVQEGTIDSCPGCYFMYTENQYHFGINASTLADIASNNDTYSANYKDIVFRNSNTLSLANNQFLGFTVNNGAIDKAYVCGVAGNTNNLTPFCIEGIKNGTANTQSNKDLIMSVFSSAYNPNNIYTCYQDENNSEEYYRCDDEEYTTIYTCWSDHSSSKYFECEYNMSDLEPYSAVTFWESLTYGEYDELIDVGNGYDHDCYINNGGEFFCVDETN